ncbi:MAG: WecB/TagA/CpsF family glycosyltransferase [Candidatus Omnitrophica bacterium]|nr:WecB/TagA/CpsF family glycosyltransferase [Candidatus Omnitrophota bacterium]
MVNLGKFPILGVQVSAVDIDYARNRIIECARNKTTLAVTALAVHGVMTGYYDLVQRRRLNGIDLVVPDGQPVRWALRLIHGVSLADRIRGSDLTFEVLKQAEEAGISVYFYGSTKECLGLIVDRFKSQFPKLLIAGSEPSKFRKISDSEKARIIENIKKSGAGIVFVGLGCPRQEVWVYEYKKFLSLPLIAVGAAFDFHSGLLRQAPKWMRSAGLEWLYRFIQEPKRLWKRYLIMNPVYINLILLQSLKLKKVKVLSPDGCERVESYG